MVSKIVNKISIYNFITILVIALFTSFLSSCNNVEKPWIINAKIEIDGISQAYLYKVNVDRTDSLIDSTNISQNKFSFNGLNNVNRLGVYSIKFTKGHGSGVTCFVNNGDEINIDILGEYKNIFSGNDIQKDYSKYMETKQQEVDLMKELMSRMNTKATKEELEANREWYSNKTDSINVDKANIISKISTPELNGYLALEEILTSSIVDKNKFEMYSKSLTDKGRETVYGKKVLEISQYFEAYKLLFNSVLTDYEELHQKYELLDEANKNSKFGAEVSKKLSVLEALNYGKMAPPLVAKTLEGRKFNLEQVKAKIVLIDFWASWCGPCRVENKNYVNLYKQFKGKGFEIVGYSLDTDLNKWKKAVKKDGLLWTNVSNLKKQKEDSIVKSYLIDAVPSNILLKDGKIVGRNLFGYELEDFLYSNIN
jgi:thiol-disulfide isomerase/thioredoxin